MYERERKASDWVEKACELETQFAAADKHHEPGMYPGEWLEPPDLTANIESYAERIDDLYNHVLISRNSGLELMRVHSAQPPVDRYCREVAIKVFLESHSLHEAFINEATYALSIKPDDELKPGVRDRWWLQLTTGSEAVQMFIKYVPKCNDTDVVVGWEYMLLGYHRTSGSILVISRDGYDERVLSAHRAKLRQQADQSQTLEHP